MTADRVDAVASACELIWVDGPDAATFLQGLVTNDVEGLAVGGARHALLLDSTGHIRSDMRVARTAPDGFTLVVEAGHGSALAALLDEYHFSEDVDVIGPERFEVATVLDRRAPATGADLVLAGRVPGTIDLIGSDAAALIAAAGATAATPHALEALRIARGVPRFGVDFTAANLVQEAGLEGSAVSFDKGCYLGQETVARVHYRGQVNRRLVGLALAGPAEPGGEIALAGRPVGTLTSSLTDGTLGPIGLGIVRREAAVGAEVTVAGSIPARIVELPFEREASPGVRTSA